MTNSTVRGLPSPLNEHKCCRLQNWCQIWYRTEGYLNDPKWCRRQLWYQIWYRTEGYKVNPIAIMIKQKRNNYRIFIRKDPFLSLGTIIKPICSFLWCLKPDHQVQTIDLQLRDYFCSNHIAAVVKQPMLQNSTICITNPIIRVES